MATDPNNKNEGELQDEALDAVSGGGDGGLETGEINPAPRGLVDFEQDTL